MNVEDMQMDLTGRDFLTLKDFTPQEIEFLLDLAAKLKEDKKNGIVKHMILVWELHILIRRVLR